MRVLFILLAIFTSDCCFSQAAKISYDDAIRSIAADKWEAYKASGNSICGAPLCDSVLFKVSTTGRYFLQKDCHCETNRRASYVSSIPWITMVDPITEQQSTRLAMDAVFDFFIIDSTISRNSFSMVTIGNDGRYPGTIHFSSTREFVISRQYECIDNIPFKQRIYFRRVKR